jgi:hypothetical protein
MLESRREIHMFMNPRKRVGKGVEPGWAYGKLCASCFHQFAVDETPVGSAAPTLEDILKEISGNVSARVTENISMHKHAIKETNEHRKTNREAGIFSDHKDRQQYGSTRREQGKGDIARILDEHLVSACVKSGFNEVFTNFALRMNVFHGMMEAAKAMGDPGNQNKAQTEAQNVAFEEAETEYLKRQALEEFDEEEGMNKMQKSLDYNDVITTADKGGVSMKLFYMCAGKEQWSHDPEARCGTSMPGKYWNRRGAKPVTCARWYCGIEQSEWPGILTRHLMPEAGAPTPTSSWRTRCKEQTSGAIAGSTRSGREAAWCSR